MAAQQNLNVRQPQTFVRPPPTLRIMDADSLIDHLRTLRRDREVRKTASKSARTRRGTLRPDARQAVLAKTGGHCHICGGFISDSEWQADHVLAHSGGGAHSIDNYLPAHKLCNNYRWDYLPEEFQYILKLGVWVRTQIEKGTVLGRACAVGFSAHEQRRVDRAKPTTRPPDPTTQSVFDTQVPNERSG